MAHCAISATKQWVEEVVIGFNFCPFARAELVENRMRYLLCSDSNAEAISTAIIEEVMYLEENQDIKTSLVVFNEALSDFDDYLDMLAFCEALFEQFNYVGKYQLASFHPDYQFDGLDFDDAANYTNRSPYPVFHIIRESALEEALASHKKPESIPIRNEKYARDKGNAFFEALLQNYKG